jgi:nitrite reductase (NADH) small subunit
MSTATTPSLLPPAAPPTAATTGLTAPVQVSVCRLKELARGMGRAFRIGSRDIAIFRTRQDEVFATDAACPHRGAPLADGMVLARVVVCPAHARWFDLDSGHCHHADTCAVRTYRVRVEEDMVVLELPEPGH